MKGMILAAGYGTRFRPATYEIPKPMVPLCNRPLIDYAIDALLEAGVREIVVNLHHFPEILRGYLERTYRDRCVIHYSYEEQILGTGGGIRRARRLLESSESFYVLNGDTVQFAPLPALEETRRSGDALAALLLRHPPKDDRFTPVFFEDGQVSGFGAGGGEPLMFSGAHAISSRIFERFPDRDFSGIVEDVYIPITRAGKEETIAGLIHDGPWFDIGTPLRYVAATRALAGEDNVIGSGSVVSPGAALIRSVLWRNCVVPATSTVVDSILCDEVELPSGGHVENALLCARREIEYAPPVLLRGRYAAVVIDSARPMVLDV